jgi:hypothetical protein
VLAVQERGGHGGDEKLRAVAVGPCVLLLGQSPETHTWEEVSWGRGWKEGIERCSRPWTRDPAPCAGG